MSRHSLSSARCRKLHHAIDAGALGLAHAYLQVFQETDRSQHTQRAHRAHSPEYTQDSQDFGIERRQALHRKLYVLHEAGQHNEQIWGNERTSERANTRLAPPPRHAGHAAHPELASTGARECSGTPGLGRAIRSTECCRRTKVIPAALEEPTPVNVKLQLELKDVDTQKHVVHDAEVPVCIPDVSVVSRVLHRQQQFNAE